MLDSPSSPKPGVSPKLSNINLLSPLSRSIMPPKLDLNTGSELHQYANYLQGEIETYRQMVETGVQNGLNESLHFTDAVVTYNERIQKLESIIKTYDTTNATFNSNIDKSINGVRILQRAIMDRLKLKIKIPGIDELSGSSDELGIIETKKEQPPKSKFQQVEHKSEEYHDGGDEEKEKSASKQTNSSVNLSQYATRDSLNKFEHTLKMYSLSMGEKIDRQEFETNFKEIKSILAKFEQTIPILTQGMGALESDNTDIKASAEANRKGLEELNQKLSQSNNLIGILRTDVDDLIKRIETKVDIKEVSSLKMLMDITGTKIQSLCDLLEGPPNDGSQSPSKPTSIKVTILKMEGKMEEIEKKLESYITEERQQFNSSLELDKHAEDNVQKSETVQVQKPSEHLAVRAKIEKLDNRIESLENKLYQLETNNNLKETDKGIKELDDVKRNKIIKAKY